MKWVNLVDGYLTKICTMFEYLMAGLLGVMLATNAVNIFCRTVLDSAFDWVWPWTMTMFVWWVLLAFFPLYRLKKDVSIYFVLRNNPPVMQRVLGIFVYLAVIFVMGILLITGPDRLAAARGTIEIVGLPRTVLVMPLILSAGLILLDAVVNLTHLINGSREYKPFGKVEVDS